MYRIAFAGSRRLSPAQHIVRVTNVVKQALTCGCAVTGCATGADELVIKAVLSSTPLPLTNRLSIFTILGRGGIGGWKWTATNTVRTASARGAEVRWNAGGEGGTALRRQLRQRTLAMLDDLDRDGKSGLVAFWTESPGTRLSMVEAAKRGLRVVAYQLEGHPLPSLGNGHWKLRNGFPDTDPRKGSAIWIPD